MDIKPCEATLGATITGVGLGEGLDDDTFGKIEAAWHQYGVLIFPGQDLSDEMHIAFSRRFGELERSLDVFRGIAEDRRVPPELIILSNVKDDGTLWPHKSEHGLFLKGNRGWHTDSSFKRVPAMESLLAAHQVPDTGGGTEFADMRAAYDDLTPDMQAWLEDRIAVHSYTYSQGLVGGLTVLSEEEQAALPPVQHPLIRTHPKTGRKNLYIGRHASHILSEDEAESRTLLLKSATMPVSSRAPLPITGTRATLSFGITVACCIAAKPGRATRPVSWPAPPSPAKPAAMNGHYDPFIPSRCGHCT
jgi:alpha-ketoglutarate-dependent 2,4-dichlorophenoxyacetate dioxygenase